MSDAVAILDAAEVAQLNRFEERIQQGLASFIEVGEALSAIRERRLYRATHGTFEDYCREKWGMSRVHAHNLIRGSEAVSALATANKSAVTSERQARELAKVPAPEREAVVEKAIQATGGKITAAAIREAAKPAPVQVVAATPDKTAEAAPTPPIVFTEAAQLWATAKGRLDNIRKNDPERLTILREVVAYAQARIERNN